MKQNIIITKFYPPQYYSVTQKTRRQGEKGRTFNCMSPPASRDNLQQTLREKERQKHHTTLEKTHSTELSLPHQICRDAK